MSYKNKLLNLISESSVVFGGIEYDNSQGDEDTTLAEIKSAMSLYGVTFHQYDDGVLTVFTRTRSAVLAFTQFLDDNEHVDAYDITAKVYDAYGVVNDNEEIDFDIVADSEFIEYYIDVVISSEQVEYSPVYVDVDNIEDNSIDIPFNYYDTDDVVGVLPQSDTPLLINVVDVDSHSPFGSFSVTVHPNDESKFLIQCNYSDIPSVTDVYADLELINNHMNNAQLQDAFSIVTPAEYHEDELSTTSAIYQSKDKKQDVLNIVEAFKDNSIIYYSQELHEIKRIIKINFRGKKRVKMQCAKGYKFDEGRKVCVKISGSELSLSRIAHRQMARTKKSKGEGYKRRIVRKTNRAKRFRKLIGLK